MSPPPPREEPPCDCIGARTGADGGAAHYRMTPAGLEPVPNNGGEGPCCDAPRWPECDACPHFSREEALLCRMEEERPADAPTMAWLGHADAVEACQIEAFEAGDEDWWRYGEGFVAYERDAAGRWVAMAEEAG